MARPLVCVGERFVAVDEDRLLGHGGDFDGSVGDADRGRGSCFGGKGHCGDFVGVPVGGERGPECFWG